jgi:hypothetical protein
MRASQVAGHRADRWVRLTAWIAVLAFVRLKDQARALPASIGDVGGTSRRRRLAVVPRSRRAVTGLGEFDDIARTASRRAHGRQHRERCSPDCPRGRAWLRGGHVRPLFRNPGAGALRSVVTPISPDDPAFRDRQYDCRPEIVDSEARRRREGSDPAPIAHPGCPAMPGRSPSAYKFG